jgi:hypothetical protein
MPIGRVSITVVAGLMLLFMVNLEPVAGYSPAAVQDVALSSHGYPRLAFDPTGTRLAVASAVRNGSANVVFLNVPDLTPVRMIRADSEPTAIGFDPTGKYFTLAIAPSANTDNLRFVIVSTETWAGIHADKSPHSPISSLCYDPIGDLMYVASARNREIFRYEVGSWTAQKIGALESGTGAVSSLSISPNSRFGVMGTTDRTLLVWPLGNPEEVRTLGTREFTETVTSVAFSQDSNFLAAGDKTGKILLCYRTPDNLWAWKGILQLSSGGVTGCLFLKDRSLVTASSTGEVSRWNIENPNQPLETIRMEAGDCEAIAADPKGKWMAVGGKRVMLFPVAQQDPYEVTDTPAAPITVVEKAPLNLTDLYQGQTPTAPSPSVPAPVEPASEETVVSEEKVEPNPMTAQSNLSDDQDSTAPVITAAPRTPLTADELASIPPARKPVETLKTDGDLPPVEGAVKPLEDIPLPQREPEGPPATESTVPTTAQPAVAESQTVPGVSPTEGTGQPVIGGGVVGGEATVPGGESELGRFYVWVSPTRDMETATEWSQSWAAYLDDGRFEPMQIVIPYSSIDKKVVLSNLKNLENLAIEGDYLVSYLAGVITATKEAGNFPIRVGASSTDMISLNDWLAVHEAVARVCPVIWFLDLRPDPTLSEEHANKIMESIYLKVALKENNAKRKIGVGLLTLSKEGTYAELNGNLLDALSGKADSNKDRKIVDRELVLYLADRCRSARRVTAVGDAKGEIPVVPPFKLGQ